MGLAGADTPIRYDGGGHMATGQCVNVMKFNEIGVTKNISAAC